MTFAPDVTERLARARADLRMGVPVVLDGGAVMMAAETVDAVDPAVSARCRVVSVTSIPLMVVNGPNLSALGGEGHLVPGPAGIGQLRPREAVEGLVDRFRLGETRGGIVEVDHFFFLR